MTEIVRPGPEHAAALAEFFAVIDTPEVRYNFNPHPLTAERAREVCRYPGKDEYYVALQDGAVAAYGMLRGWDEGYDVPALGICVRPGLLGRGVGSGLMSRLIASARARKAARLILKVKRSNARAVAFYRSFGFVLSDLDAESFRGTLDLAGTPELSAIVTTINEVENLPLVIPRLQELCAQEAISLEIVVIDGGSTDGTPEAARALGCRVHAQTGPGYAQAIRDGIAQVRGDYVVLMDADLSHAPEDAVGLFKDRLRADIVINSRYAPGGGSDTEAWRDGLSRLLNWLYRLALGLPFREVSGGFRLYRRRVLQGLVIESRFFEVQEEIIIKAHWKGFSAIERPYRYRARGKGVSKARVLQYGWHLLAALVKFWWKRPA